MRQFGQQKDDLLRRYEGAKGEIQRLRNDNDKLRGELRLQRVPPREGAKCQTCGTVKVSLSSRETSPRTLQSPGRALRSGSVALDGQSPRSKALPMAPPSDDEGEDDDEELPPLPQAAKPRHLLSQSSPNTNSSAVTGLSEEPKQRGSTLKALDPAAIRRSMQQRYGDETRLEGRRSGLVDESESSADASDSSDAPEPPPRPVSLVKADSVPAMSLLPGPKSPRYASDPMKTSIPTGIKDSPDRDSFHSRQSGNNRQSGNSARVGSSDMSGGSSERSSSNELRNTIGKNRFGSLSKANNKVSGIFRRGQFNSSNMDSYEASADESDAYQSSPPDAHYGTLAGSSSSPRSQHSLMDPTESLRWRRQALGEGGACVTLTPINVTTINKTIYYLVRVESPDTAWVVPRTFEQFRDFRQNLMFEFPAASVPQPPSKLFKGNVKEKTVGDRLMWLQTFLDSLLSDHQLAGSVLLLKFLDPFYRPSPLALRAITLVREGTLQYRSDKTTGKALRPMLCMLKHDLYVFRSQEDQSPFQVVPLEYCMLDLVAETADIPRFSFQIVSLREGESFTFAASSSKELAEWILSIRDEKTKRISFCHDVVPQQSPALEDALNHRRTPVSRLLSDFAESSPAKSKLLLARCVLPNDFVPPVVRAEPETGMSKDVNGGILAATETKLLHAIFDPKSSEKSFAPVFFIAFRYFSSPLEALTYCKEKYVTGSAEMKERCILVLEQWFSLHFYDFLDSMILTQNLLDFVILHCAPQDLEGVKTALSQALQWSLQQPESAGTPQSILPQIFRGNTFDLLDLAPMEVARQLTLVQHALLVDIDACELLQERWTGPEASSRSPNVGRFIADWNHFCGWVSSVIVCTRPPIPRIALIHRFIDVAKCCLDLNNFNATMAIVGALLVNPVHRLKDDWESIPKDSQDTFAELKALFTTSGNFKAYRAAVSGAAAPAIPYLGLILQDLTFLETNKDSKMVGATSMVNLDKSEKILNVLSDLHRFQRASYALKPLPAVQQYLTSGTVLTSAEQDAKSFQIRPKGSGGESPRGKVVWKKEYSPRRGDEEK